MQYLLCILITLTSGYLTAAHASASATPFPASSDETAWEEKRWQYYQSHQDQTLNAQDIKRAAADAAPLLIPGHFFWESTPERSHLKHSIVEVWLQKDSHLRKDAVHPSDLSTTLLELLTQDLFFFPCDSSLFDRVLALEPRLLISPSGSSRTLDFAIQEGQQRLIAVAEKPPHPRNTIIPQTLRRLTRLAYKQGASLDYYIEKLSSTLLPSAYSCEIVDASRLLVLKAIRDEAAQIRCEEEAARVLGPILPRELINLTTQYMPQLPNGAISHSQWMHGVVQVVG